MRLAFTNLACPGWSIDRTFDAAQRYGYEGLEMRLFDGDVITPQLPTEKRQQVIVASRRTGLPIICLDTSVQVAQPDPAARESQVQQGLAMLELAASWQAPTIRVFGGAPTGSDLDLAFKGAAECLSRLAVRGAELGVDVLIETHDVVAAGARVASILNAVPDPAAGALWDTLHPCRMGESPETTWTLLGQRLRHVHIKDGQRPADGNPDWPLKLLGKGDVPIKAILKTLKANGYEGWLSVEWEKKWHPDIEEPEIALPQHIALLHEYLAVI